MLSLVLDLLPGRLAICRLEPLQPAPARPAGAAFWSVTQTSQETSVVVPEEHVVAGWSAERGWRCLRVRGPLPFDMLGVLHALTAPLADARVSVFCLSTYDTDYVLVQQHALQRARQALAEAGHRVVEATD